jgi:hypothetical protein
MSGNGASTTSTYGVRAKRIEKLRYMHRNPVKRGLVLEAEQWEWSSFRSYAYQEVGRVGVNLWPEGGLKIRGAA